MTFEHALIELKQGKKVSRAKGVYLEMRGNRIWCVNTLTDSETPIISLHIDAILTYDWEIYSEKNQPDKSDVSVGGLICKVTSNFDEYEQALDKFRCRLEDLREAAVELSGLQLEVHIPIGDKKG